MRSAFACPRLTATPEELAALGIIIAEPKGSVIYAEHGNSVVAEIGAIVVQGNEIRVFPRERLSEEYRRQLVGAAESAVWERPRKSDGWRYGGGKWTMFLLAYASDLDVVALAIRASRRRASTETL